MVNTDTIADGALAVAGDDLEGDDVLPGSSDGIGGSVPLEEAGDDDLGIRLGFYIHDASRVRRTIFDAALKPAGVTHSQASVLAHLSRADGMAQSDLAQQLDLGKVALGGLIDRLEAAGLVERRADGGDRRVKRIFLTTPGRRVVTRMRTISERTNSEILAGIDPEDVRTTARTLRALKANMLRMANGAGDEQ